MRKSSLLACSIITVTAFGISGALGHHPGIGGVGGSGGITTIGAGTLDQGQGAMALLLEYTRFRQLSDAMLITNDVHGIKSIESRILALSYGLTNDLMISARLPWVGRTGIVEGDSGGGVVNDRGGASGIGDLTLLGQYRFFNNQAKGTQLAALFGVKAPTGATGRIDQLGELFEAEFQPGSGSWDALIGLAISQRLNSRWALHANVLGIKAGTGTQDTNLGDRLLYNAALVYRVFGDTATEAHGHGPYAHVPRASSIKHAKPPTTPHAHIALDVILELNGEWHDKQRTGGISDPNSGGNTLYLSPGLRMTVENWSGFATIGMPVVTDVNGVQSKSAWRLVTGIAAAFGP